MHINGGYFMPSKIRRREIPRLLCLMAVFALTGCGPLLELNQKYAHPEIYVNYGTAVSTDISEYVNMDTLSKEEQKYVKKSSIMEIRFPGTNTIVPAPIPSPSTTKIRSTGNIR